MKQKRRVTIVELWFHGKTIHEAIAHLQALDADHSSQYTDIRLNWDGDSLELVGYREETDDEEQIRMKLEARERAGKRVTELRTLARLKAKYENTSSQEEENAAAYHECRFTPLSEVIDEPRQKIDGDKAL